MRKISQRSINNKFMKKMLVVTVVAVALVGTLWKAQTDPSVGQYFLSTLGQVESRIRGFHEKTVVSDGIAYRLYEGGDPKNPTLVLLHGYSADKDVWPRFASNLVDDFHIVIPDMAGHGETGFNPKWTYDIPSQAKRVVGLMDTLHIERFHVAGNSMGGMITATLALDYPERIITATPIDPAGVISPKPSGMEQMLEKGRNPFQVRDEKSFREFYSMTMAKPPYLPDFVLKGLEKTYIERREELAVMFKHFYGHNMLDDRLQELKVPMLIIWGDQDELIDVSAVPVWKAKAPGLKTEIMPGIGHMPMLEAPEQTAELVKSFIFSKTLSDL